MHIERELINRILLNCCLSGFLGSFSSRRDVKWDCCRFRSTNGLVRFRWSPASLLIRLGGKFRGYIYSINFFCFSRFVFWTFLNFAFKGDFLNISISVETEQSDLVQHQQQPAETHHIISVYLNRYCTIYIKGFQFCIILYFHR